MLLYEKKQVLIYISLVISVCGLVYFRYLPLHRELGGSQDAKASEIAAISKSRTDSQHLSAFKDELERIQGRVGNYDVYVPSHRNLGEFLRKIADLMSKYSLSDQLVQPGKEEEINGLYCIPISMQCEGQLEQIFGFFKSLQELNRAVRIVGIELNNDSQFSGQVSMQTKTYIYYCAQPEQEG